MLTLRDTPSLGAQHIAHSNRVALAGFVWVYGDLAGLFCFLFRECGSTTCRSWMYRTDFGLISLVTQWSWNREENVQPGLAI